MTTTEKPWSMQLPVAEAEPAYALCPVEPNAANSALFRDWEAPFTWPHIRSLMEINHTWNGEKAMWFTLNRRPLDEVWKTGWHLWYDKAVLTKEAVPSDLTLKGTFAFEEVTTGYGSDNNVHVHPWVGIVARMQDLRRYYYLCLEYPRAVVLYRREDNHWLELARHQVHIDVWAPYRLELRARGSRFEARLDGTDIFAVTDYAYADGKAGVRVTCTSIVKEFEMHAEPGAVQAFNIGRTKAEKEIADAAAALPKPEVLREADLSAYGDRPDLLFGPFASPGFPREMLITTSTKTGPTHVLRTLAGEVLWEADLKGFDRFQATPPREDGCCDIYGYTKDAFVVVDGKTGRVKQHRALVDFPNPPRKRPGFTPDVLANLSGKGQTDYILTEGTNERHLWAFDRDLNPLWDVGMASGGGHGSQITCCDINGDGREEVFGGATLVSADGEVVWTQREVVARLMCPNGGHIDSAQMGFFAGPGEIPTVHMQASSAGALVVNALTGEMLEAHPQGHVQGGCGGRIVPGVPGIQIIASCRWGNYGLTGVYDGLGRRLSRFQPDYASDALHAINWTGGDVEHLIIGGSSYRTGIYDWMGRRLIDLSRWTGPDNPHTLRNKHAQCVAARLTSDPRDCIAIRVASRLVILAPDRPLTPGTRVLAPHRRGRVSTPAWETV